MNLSTLKKYAPRARREFIQAVGERAALFGITEDHLPEITFSGDVALIDGQAMSRTVGQQCNKLCEKIRDAGYQNTMEQVAYIWFNRLVAIRYMELHDYLDHGYRVLSSRDGADDQPEILRYAEQVNLPGLDRDRVIELKLDGNKDAELYREVLLGQCRALHQAMPFLFETIGEETELLLPQNLLHSDSLVRNLVRNSPAEEWQEIEVIGWLYQFYISEKKDEVFDGLKKNKKITPENIPAATQLFTPHWIVRYLVENSLGRLWLLNRPGSRLRDHMPYYIRPVESGECEVDSKTDSTHSPLPTSHLRISSPEEIRICDPACGSGHMLTYAFDLLYAIYEEEGYEPAEIPEKILTHNLYGIEIDERAGELAAFALTMKARAKQRRFFNKGVKPNICVLENVHFDGNELKNYMDFVGRDLFTAPLQTTLRQFEEADNFGSLIRPDVTDVDGMLRILESKNVSGQLFISMTHQKVLQALRQADYLSPKYHVVIANPPYMGGSGMNGRLNAWAKDNYNQSRSDLFSMFMERNSDLAMDNGSIAMITMQSWMFLDSYKAMRESLFNHLSVLTMAHLGERGFDSIGGAVVATTAFVLKKTRDEDLVATYVRLVEGRSEYEKSKMFLDNLELRYKRALSALKPVPSFSLLYWLSERFLQPFGNGVYLDSVCMIKSGMSTTDNARFLRFWHEVENDNFGRGCQTLESASESNLKWFPFKKGGGFRRWYGNDEYVLNWHNDGEEIKSAVVNNPSDPNTTHWSRRIFGVDQFFKPGITWTKISSSKFSCREHGYGHIFSDASNGIFEAKDQQVVLGLLNSSLGNAYLGVISPTLNYKAGDVAKMPLIELRDSARSLAKSKVENCTKYSQIDWDSFETSWDFTALPLLNPDYRQPTLKATYQKLRARWREMTQEMQRLEEENNRIFIEAYGLQDELTPEVPLNEITLTCNPHYRYGGDKNEEEREALLLADTLRELVSYAVGCMMGRYSLDHPGLILANAGDAVEDYYRIIGNHEKHEVHEKGTSASSVPSVVKNCTYTPDEDGILPLTELPWFDDDVTERVIEFLETTFGKESLEENLTFLADNLGPKKNETSRETIRRYLCNNFFTDHTQTYKKRPIYWLFSSGKEKAFSALVYLHRYNEGTLARMRTEYVVPLLGRIPRRIEDLTEEIETAGATAQQTRLRKQKDKLGKQLDELRAFDEKLRHAADQRISIDLDDGVKVNYGKFGDLLADVKKITGEK